MASIKIETGLKTYDIEDEHGNIRGQITINPKDMSFFGKAQKMRDTILHYMDDIDITDQSKDENEIVKLFDDTGFERDAELKDWLFDGDKYHNVYLMHFFVKKTCKSFVG